MNHDGKWSSSSDRKTCFSQGRLYHQYNVHQYSYTTTLVQAPSNTHLSTSPPSSSEFCSHGNNGELRMNEKEMIIHSISSSHCLSCVSSRFLNFFAKFSDCRWRLPNFVCFELYHIFLQVMSGLLVKPMHLICIWQSASVNHFSSLRWAFLPFLLYLPIIFQTVNLHWGIEFITTSNLSAFLNTNIMHFARDVERVKG